MIYIYMCVCVYLYMCIYTRMFMYVNVIFICSSWFQVAPLKYFGSGDSPNNLQISSVAKLQTLVLSIDRYANPVFRRYKFCIGLTWLIPLSTGLSRQPAWWYTCPCEKYENQLG